MAPPLIIEILGRTDQGITRPFRCLADDGHHYYVKSVGAHWRSVVCEWIAGRLAEALGLPIAPFAQVELDDGLVKAYGDHDLAPGLAFGSRVATSVHEFEPSLIRRCHADFRRDLLAFDWWVRNEDRQLGDTAGRPNLLWQSTAARPVVIDHNNAFDRQFDAASFLDWHIFRAEWPTIASDLVRQAEYAQRFTAVATRAEEFWCELPHNWVFTEDGTPRITLQEIQSVLHRADQPDFWHSAPSS